LTYSGIGLSPVFGRMVIPEKVVYSSFDGELIHAYLYRPRDRQPGQRFPSLPWIHGGPTSQFMDTYQPMVQYFVQAGYVVLLPNIRGSSGYGRRFEALNDRDWGHSDLQDAIHGVEYLKTLDDVDPESFGITGTSYGGSMTNSVIAVAIVHWPRYARIVRSLVMGIKQLEYVTASRVIAASDARILFRALLPNAIAPTLVLATLEIGGTILTLASLSFLGLGSSPPTPAWGKMVAEGAGAFDQWWIGTFPGLAILVVVMGFNFLGDGIRDALDPRLRKGD
jgi:hypothetical protein